MQLVIAYFTLLKVNYYFINILFYSSYTGEPFPYNSWHSMCDTMIGGVGSSEAAEKDSPGKVPRHHTSVKLKHIDRHMYKLKVYPARIQWSGHSDSFILSP